MKRLYFIFILAILISGIQAQEKYSRVKLYVTRDQLEELAISGLYIDHGIFKSGAYVICELSQREIEIASEQGVKYEVLIDDVTKYYVERNEPYLSDLDALEKMEYELSREWPVPEGFELGSCGGFLTIDQAMAHLDDMASLYPDLISQREPLSYETHNGRQLWWVRLSDNPDADEDEPEVLYTGMHHAREPIGLQLLVYYMYYLLENYNTDPDVQYIVDNFELYFIPIVNMDGYAYNIQNNPNGGGNWRKNRSQNFDGSYGVDINRNYGYMWGYNNSGSSPVPSDDTYRGESAFSEPETQCIRDFCEDHEFRIALNYHSYANLFLYAWGWSATPCEHDAIYHGHAEIMTRENGYTFGPGYTTIYATNGGSDDWMYGEQASKPLIFAYTPEVGGGSDGFWPSVNRIIPLCQEHMYANLMAARLSGPYALVRDLAPTILESQNGMLFFDIQRLGLEDGASYTVSIEPLNDAMASVSGPFVYNDLEILETASAAFTYTLKEGILSGEEVKYLLSVNNGLATFSDTITKIYGTPVVIFEDDASDFSKWTSNKWNTTTQQYHSSPRSMADSPVGNYGNQETNIITLKDPVDLSDRAYASLSFWAKWDIEAGWDYVQVLISDDNGASWNPMQGKYTKIGNSNQALGEPLYDGVQNSWVKEEISLSQYIDKQIKIRFALVSDLYENGDGFFWDDMELAVIDVETGFGPEDTGAGNEMITIYPNPSAETVTLALKENPGNGNMTLKIYNLQGQLIYQHNPGGMAGEIKIDVRGWAPGIYFCCLEDDQTVPASCKFIIR